MLELAAVGRIQIRNRDSGYNFVVFLINGYLHGSLFSFRSNYERIS